MTETIKASQAVKEVTGKMEKQAPFLLGWRDFLVGAWLLSRLVLQSGVAAAASSSRLRPPLTSHLF